MQHLSIAARSLRTAAMVAVAGGLAVLPACGGSTTAGSTTTSRGGSSGPATQAPATSAISRTFTTGSGGAGTLTGLHRIRHVFVIMLENKDYKTSFGGTDAWFSKTLPHMGTLLSRYYGTAHHSAGNYIGLVSGQPPTPDTQSDCQTFSNFPAASKLSGGIQGGNGCVYPSNVKTIGNQLTSAHFTWKAYEQDMGNIPTREAAACGHPVVGAADHTEQATKGDGYAARHDPFVYFHSVIDQKASCGQHVVALGSPTGAMPKGAVAGETGLATDLKSLKTTPNFSFITPNLCQDGHDYPCVNQTSKSSVFADMESFLKTWIPKITGSAAYRQDGLLMITFDESEGTFTDSTACCNEQPGPAASQPGINGPGGGRVGAVLMSPFITPGTVSTTPYNHYSALATFETIFGLPRLGEASRITRLFGADVFKN
jgi:hypothetical protein